MRWRDRLSSWSGANPKNRHWEIAFRSSVAIGPNISQSTCARLSSSLQSLIPKLQAPVATFQAGGASLSPDPPPKIRGSMSIGGSVCQIAWPTKSGSTSSALTHPKASKAQTCSALRRFLQFHCEEPCQSLSALRLFTPSAHRVS